MHQETKNHHDVVADHLDPSTRSLANGVQHISHNLARQRRSELKLPFLVELLHVPTSPLFSAASQLRSHGGVSPDDGQDLAGGNDLVGSKHLQHSLLYLVAALVVMSGVVDVPGVNSGSEREFGRHCRFPGVGLLRAVGTVAVKDGEVKGVDVKEADGVCAHVEKVAEVGGLAVETRFLASESLVVAGRANKDDDIATVWVAGVTC